MAGSFEDWFIQQGQPEPADAPEELQENGRQDDNAEGGWLYPCNRCEELSPIYCEPADFNPNHHYCARSERCIP